MTFRIANWMGESPLHLNFYILDHPNPNQMNEPTIDEAVENLNRRVNQGLLMIDLSGKIGISARFKAREYSLWDREFIAHSTRFEE